MDTNKLLDELTFKMLPYPINKYAKAIGIKNLYNLTLVVGGSKIYIPKPDGLFREYIKQRIIEDYSTGNFTIEVLSKKYDISEKTVWSYINLNKF